MSGPGSVNYDAVETDEMRRRMMLESRVKEIAGGEIVFAGYIAIIKWLQNPAVPANGKITMCVNLLEPIDDALRELRGR